LLKFFPAGPSGGIAYLKSIAAPYAHLGVEYIPLGGLDSGNFTDYLALDCVPAVGGSWIAPRDLIQRQDWETITQNACEAIAKLSGR
jgi:2-dehydro-3-deoxyphosphogluconate aldolase/(4S)-4-hydroxy-2-oxoglutarate aldolase